MTTVQTSAGAVRGTTGDGIHAFKGIPYAGDTGGTGRFRPPTAAVPWRGTRDASDFGVSSPQNPLMPDDVPEEYLMGMGILKEEPSMREDCLVLNVWTPGPDPRARRPVLVWFHGGGYLGGSASWPWYDGHALAARGDVVIVTVNHRLGIFGYLHLGELLGPDYATSGNVGMLDLVAALEWVRDNVRQFGGDPANVTIFGESGGGLKVSTLLAMPSASGLFTRAVVQSGPGLSAGSVHDATVAARRVADELGINPTDTAAWQTSSVDDLLRAQHGLSNGGLIAPGVRPVLDGISIPRHLGDALAAGTSGEIALMIGTTRDEMVSLLRPDPALNDTRLEAALAHMLGDDATPLLAGYRQLRPTMTPYELLIAIMTDGVMRIPSTTLAERKLSGGSAPVYMYLWSWCSPGSDKAAHGHDVPFWFANTAIAPALGPDTKPLSLQAADALIAFASTGDPKHPGLPNWAPYSLPDRPTLEFNTTSRLINDPFSDTSHLWDSVEPTRMIWTDSAHG
jgi:para-nitrobenzyl esterase